jgi:hypothetical protein
MNVSTTKSIGSIYEELSKILDERISQRVRRPHNSQDPLHHSQDQSQDHSQDQHHPYIGVKLSGNSDIDLQHFSIKNLKSPVNDDDATTKQFVLNSIRDDTLHLKRTGDIMTGNIDMGGNSSVINLDDKEFNPKDTTAATVGYVKRKVYSHIPKANLNIICSQGFKGKKQKSSTTDDIYRFFPAGIVFPSDAYINKVYLTTTNDPVANSTHKLIMISSDPLKPLQPAQTEDVLEKQGENLYCCKDFTKAIGSKKVIFQLDSYTGNVPTPIFTGESTLTLEISV